MTSKENDLAWGDRINAADRYWWQLLTTLFVNYVMYYFGQAEGLTEHSSSALPFCEGKHYRALSSLIFSYTSKVYASVRILYIFILFLKVFCRHLCQKHPSKKYKTFFASITGFITSHFFPNRVFPTHFECFSNLTSRSRSYARFRASVFSGESMLPVLLDIRELQLYAYHLCAELIFSSKIIKIAASKEFMLCAIVNSAKLLFEWHGKVSRCRVPLRILLNFVETLFYRLSHAFVYQWPQCLPPFD